MHSNVLALALALFSTLTPATGANIGSTKRAPSPDLTLCTTCTLTQRSDGTHAIIDTAIHETIARATIYSPDALTARGDDSSHNIPAEDSIFAKRDSCTGVKCNNRAECAKYGCDNGCNTNGKCHIGVEQMCPRGCKIWRREGEGSGGVMEIRDAVSGEVVGHAE
ncbi:hypothetical protein QBC34DRAFT_386794 [Podospora aff. communis PSN243]|uniref:Uncharacterized protein n=1 Tax=Podospora aff. communis PSN243 TaxID=3040156 RepID=A0AAV9G489_9PEZI|nr:hypothetical protein QBC34DRAFT_386794 [Podospora aff. communis PSN243]